MEGYISQTEGILTIIQSAMKEEERDKSAQAGIELWEHIRALVDKHDLTISEMLCATLGCHLTIIETANDQINETKKELGL